VIKPMYYPVVLYPPLIREFIISSSKREEALKKEALKNKYLVKSQSPCHQPSAEPSLLARILVWIKNVWSRFWGEPQPPQQPRQSPQPPSPQQPKVDGGERMRRLKQLLAGKVMRPIGVSSAQRGVSEQRFYDTLRKFFPVTFGGEFPIPDSQYVYSADLQIIYGCGIAIDIEVDEPYDGRSLQPHHCLDQGKDQRRNEFFLKGNWIVVRFAEIQVVKYPYECAAVIEQVLSEITGGKPRLSIHKPLPPVKLWTISQAKKMARSRFRQTYLPGWNHNRNKPRKQVKRKHRKSSI